MAGTKQLNAKLEAYLKDPHDTLDLAGMNFGIKGAQRVAEALPKW